MKLYDGGRAPNPRRVRVFLAEKGISVPLKPVDIGRGEHRSAAYTAIDPMQRVPTLVLDDGTAISESVAICRYFEEIQPDPPLFGQGAVERAIVEMWQRRIEFYLLGPIAASFRHSHPAMAAFEVPQVPAWAEASRAKVEPFLRILDAQLAGRDYICGERFTVADISGLIGIDFMRLPKIAVPGDLADLRRWHAAVSARPSATA